MGFHVAMLFFVCDPSGGFCWMGLLNLVFCPRKSCFFVPLVGIRVEVDASNAGMGFHVLKLFFVRSP